LLYRKPVLKASNGSAGDTIFHGLGVAQTTLCFEQYRIGFKATEATIFETILK